MVALWALIALLACCSTSLAKTGPATDELVLAENGRTAFRIVTAEDAPPGTRFAAAELQRFLGELSGAEFPIATDKEPPTANEILLGDSRSLRRTLPDFDGNRHGTEGYLLQVVAGKLVIAGGQPRGDLYGVYGLLQDHFDCRWFTPRVSRIPKTPRLAIPPLHETRSPAFEFREVMLFDCWDPDWLARNRLGTSTRYLDDSRGGTVRFVPGYYAHTFYNFLPPDEYFDQHPEFYGEVGGTRLRKGGQLCGTNEEAAKIIAGRVRNLFRDNPGASIISLSQNDGNENYCRCPRCAALDAAEGTHAAQVLCLVNRVAEAIEKDLPDKSIETLAYVWSQTPPKSLQTRANVIVRLSSINCSFSSPIQAQRSRNRAFHNDLVGWSKACKRLWIWNYTTYYSWYLVPFPDWRTLDQNIRYFAGHGVTGVLEQNNWQSTGSELAPLKGYVLSKLLWDPAYGRDRAIDEFLQEVYGPASPCVREYLDLLCDKVETEKIDMTIYGSRTPKWLAGDVLDQADAIWERAEASVADQPDRLRNVRRARLNTDYVLIERYRFKPGNMITYDGNPRAGKVTAIDPTFEKRIRRFLEVSGEMGITHLREGEPDAAANTAWLNSLLPENHGPEVSKK